MQDLSIYGLKSFFYLSTLLEILWQDINSFISFAISIINPKVIPWLFLSLMDMLKAQTLYIHIILDIIIVCKYEEFMFAVF